MPAPADLLRLIDAHGPQTFDQLENLAPGDDFLASLDALLDDGHLALAYHPDQPLDHDRYTLTPSGRTLLTPPPSRQSKQPEAPAETGARRRPEGPSGPKPERRSARAAEPSGEAGASPQH